jgi:hypothetical protein
VEPNLVYERKEREDPHDEKQSAERHEESREKDRRLTVDPQLCVSMTLKASPNLEIRMFRTLSEEPRSKDLEIDSREPPKADTPRSETELPKVACIASDIRPLNLEAPPTETLLLRRANARTDKLDPICTNANMLWVVLDLPWDLRLSDEATQNASTTENLYADPNLMQLWREKEDPTRMLDRRDTALPTARKSYTEYSQPTF